MLTYFCIDLLVCGIFLLDVALCLPLSLQGGFAALGQGTGVTEAELQKQRKQMVALFLSQNITIYGRITLDSTPFVC